jgi:hypothetical protein
MLPLALLLGLLLGLARGAQAGEEDIRPFSGNCPPITNSFGTLILNMTRSTFQWISVDSVLGAVNATSVTVSTWKRTGTNPERLTFIGMGGNAVFYGDVLFGSYNRGVVDVIRAGRHIRYLVVLACVATATEWVGVDPGDGKTNYEPGRNPGDRGGGDRIFAERNQPPGRKNAQNQPIDQIHDRIQIRAKLNAPVPRGQNITIFFKIFDPDHYSADTDFDPNGARAANDNIKSGGAIEMGARLRKADFSADADSVTIVGDNKTKEAIIGMEISARQPTNNFIVVAHCEQAYVNSVVFGDDGKTLKESRAAGPNVPKEFQTPLLTVWRTVYTEQDRMKDPDFTQGPAKSRIASGNVTAIAGKTLTTDVKIHAPGGTNQFQNGKIELLKANNDSLGVVDVEGNTTGDNSQVTLKNNPPAGVAKFKNLEDDDIAGAINSEKMAPDLSFWATRYEPSCVLVNTTKADLSSANDTSVNNNDVDFETNIGTAGTDADEQAAIKAKVKANKKSTSSEDFWVIYQLGAFQGRVNEDCDPNTEDPTLGVSSFFSKPADDTEAGTLLYREVTLDAAKNLTAIVKISEANLWSATSVHESGHEWGMTDGATDGPLMNPIDVIAADTPAKVNALVFNGSGLRKIILKNFPGR